MMKYQCAYQLTDVPEMFCGDRSADQHSWCTHCLVVENERLRAALEPFANHDGWQDVYHGQSLVKGGFFFPWHVQQAQAEFRRASERGPRVDASEVEG